MEEAADLAPSPCAHEARLTDGCKQQQPLLFACRNSAEILDYLAMPCCDQRRSFGHN